MSLAEMLDVYWLYALVGVSSVSMQPLGLSTSG